ncbi:helix-turn-helix transcriptional regulator [Novispirillum itersonii]|uniref:DNA-binding CsgD family transcriptional regulator n=1 Tax=Novispirillum itersonii TaxID=189 RepID=A0A7W9ZHR5_NOVIT|nr:helix-turn-helix transcriptional regulator [Novispirillum itersonii]MBB6211303.1 DNA-binding CsgD family transcriptional regulator [Novispirillum itersonii]
MKEWAGREFAEKLGSMIATVRGSSFPVHLREFIQSQIAFDNLVIVVFQEDAPPVDLYYWIPDREGFRYEEQYLKLSYTLDPFFRKAQAKEEGVFLIGEIAPDRFFQSEYGKSYFSCVRMLDELGLVSAGGDGCYINLSLGRQRGSGRFSRAEKRWLDDISPALAPLLRIYAETRMARMDPPAESGAAASLEERLCRLKPQPGITEALTHREAQVIALVMGGHSNVSIAQCMGISRLTVKVHRKHAYAKLQVSSQADLFLKIMPMLEGAGRPPQRPVSSSALAAPGVL